MHQQEVGGQWYVREAEPGSKKQVTKKARAVAFRRLCFLTHWKICLLLVKVPKGMFRS